MLTYLALFGLAGRKLRNLGDQQDPAHQDTIAPPRRHLR